MTVVKVKVVLDNSPHVSSFLFSLLCSRVAILLKTVERETKTKIVYHPQDVMSTLFTNDRFYGKL